MLTCGRVCYYLVTSDATGSSHCQEPSGEKTGREETIMTIPARSGPRPRDGIIDAARDLFRKHGIRGIGVDAIADAADSNKMTRYRHVGSKDDLIVACIGKAGAEAEAFWEAL